MGITVGIDVGGSTTKIVGLNNGDLITPTMVTATDPIASLFGAFGKFVDLNLLELSAIEKIMITGVGASHMQRSIYGVPTHKVEEFLANGYGGLKLSELDEALIVSMGTGTALVHAKGVQIEHIGGTGIGGGTILGLARRMLNVHGIKLIIDLAKGGNLNNVDLMVGDLTQDILPGLPPTTTASNFGKLSDMASQEDIALGILNMVFQSIGMSAVFAVRNTGQKNIVLIGNLTSIPQCAPVFEELECMFNVNFIIPHHSEYGTAVGAALYGVTNR